MNILYRWQRAICIKWSSNTNIFMYTYIYIYIVCLLAICPNQQSVLCQWKVRPPTMKTAPDFPISLGSSWIPSVLRLNKTFRYCEVEWQPSEKSSTAYLFCIRNAKAATACSLLGIPLLVIVTEFFIESL